ncbi:hypothetical protein ACFVGN_14380 [Streptomyces sp. NPDC057757]|uniref:hypothetical protein n=1 Tax=Streptomyces sp. NPDC057757 TaxID=3346241 RepID=UPI00367CA2FF
MTVAFHLPYPCGLTPNDQLIPSGAAIESASKLDPISSNESAAEILVDGELAARCNALQIDFHKESFDRRRDVSPLAADPPVPLAFNLVNNWLSRLRLLALAPQVKPLEMQKTIWRLTYLGDDEQPLERDEELLRQIFSGVISFSAVGINAELWNAVGSLPWGYEPGATDTLLLDAAGSVEEIGPAIVLAFTALETRIGYALNLLSTMNGVSPAVWDWIQDRGDFRKAPSTIEKFDSLLKAMTRRSLKEELKLWEGFQNLRIARNSFAHDGKAVVGKSKQPVDRQEASRLISVAREIVDWIDGLLPESERRPKFDTSSMTIQSSFLLVVPDGVGVTTAEPTENGDEGVDSRG